MLFFKKILNLQNRTFIFYVVYKMFMDVYTNNKHNKRKISWCFLNQRSFIRSRVFQLNLLQRYSKNQTAIKRKKNGLLRKFLLYVSYG